MTERYTIIVALRPSVETGAVVPGHEFLMVENRKRGNRWELPGGHMIGREGAAACAAREFIEETGHELDGARLVQRRSSTFGEGYVFLGRAGRRVGAPVEAEIGRIAYFPRLPALKELSFPDDPYPELFDAVRLALSREARAAGSGRRGP